mgnify:CR=1 FL=1
MMPHRRFPLAGLAMLAMLALFPALAAAVQPDEVLADPALETRARLLSRDLRCLVCQNQSIDDSNAELARDLRLVVRERLKAGDDDRQVLAYLTNRYGDYVLLKPPVKASTYALWAAPGLLLAGGGLAVAFYYRRRNAAALSGESRADAPLSAEETRRLEALLADDPPASPSASPSASP